MVQSMLARKPAFDTVPMLPDRLYQVGRNSDVKRAVRPVRKDVNPSAHQQGGATACMAGSSPAMTVLGVHVGWQP